MPQVIPMTSTAFQASMASMFAPHPEAFSEPFDTCATCGGSLCKGGFRDTLSLREASISRTCQTCQDSIFTPNQKATTS